MRIASFVFIILFFWSSIAFSQNAAASFEHFTHEDGLSGPVTHIKQDKFGFLWLGTTDGLNRFDGRNFTVYRNTRGDSTSLPNNIINDLCVDNNGRIWVATNGGLCYYSYSDGIFHEIIYNDTLERIDRHRVHAITRGKDNSMWFATKTMVHLWNKEEKVKSIPLPNAENLTIKYLYADEKENLWIGINNGMYVYDLKKKKFVYSKTESVFSKERNLSVTVHPIVPFLGDTMVMGTWYAGIVKVVYDGEAIKSFNIEDITESDPRKYIVQALTEETDSRWWIGTYGTGISLYDPATSTFSNHFKNNPSNNKTLGSDYIEDLFTDASGIIWIGTSAGLDKYDILTQQFQSVSLAEYPGSFSVYRVPSTILEDKNDPTGRSLWITVSGFGLFHFNRTTRLFKLYSHDESDPNSLPDNTVRALYYDDRKRLWIGSRTGVCIYEPVSEKFVVPVFPNNVMPVGVNRIFQDRQKRFWFSSSTNGVFRFDETANRMANWRYIYKNPKALPDDNVFCIMEDSQGMIWIGTQNNGLCRLDPKTDEFLFFMNDKNNSASLPDNGVYDLYEDQSQNLWIATENGLGRMNLNDFSINTFTTADGLSNNDVFSITCDKQNVLWLGTNNGLSKFDPQKGTFKNYFANDGLPLNRISGAVYCATDGTLFLGTPNTISFCSPGNMKMNKKIPPVLITGIKVFDRNISFTRSGEKIDPIKLSYRQNMLTLDFAALNFTNAFLNQYAYMLEGFDATWIYCGNKQSATYTNLNGGDYTFRVKAANNDGTWNEAGSTVIIKVTPPYWKTWWFYALCTLVVSSILYAFYRIRIHQVVRLQNIRTRISRDLHDDIGSTLSSINMISSMAERSDVRGKKSTELFKTISTASNQAMELMNDIVWSVNPKNDRMEMILIRMRQYASEILEAAQISFTIETDDESRNVSLPIEKRKDFYLIFKEAINNLAKYSNAKQASIRISLSNNVLCLEVNDDGIGFVTPYDGEIDKSYGNGLRNMKARAEQLKGKISIESKQQEGTRINLKVPLSP